jgi:hypothetical protein
VIFVSNRGKVDFEPPTQVIDSKRLFTQHKLLISNDKSVLGFFVTNQLLAHLKNNQPSRY